jgi:hypothetical protein
MLSWDRRNKNSEINLLDCHLICFDSQAKSLGNEPESLRSEVCIQSHNSKEILPVGAKKILFLTPLTYKTILF